MREESQAYWINNLFGIELSKYITLKTAMSSMQRSELFVSTKIKIPDSTKGKRNILVPESEKITINNAVLLHGLLGDQKLVNKVFKDSKKRKEVAHWIELLLVKRNSVVGVGLYNHEVSLFLDIIKSDKDLKVEKLPNIFVQLPQVSLDGVGSIMEGLLAQSAVLSGGDNMVTAYLNGDLETAHAFALECATENTLLNDYKALICKTYKEAIEFEETLNLFK